VRPLLGSATLCALLALFGCGSKGPASVAEDPSSTPEVAADPEVTCGALSWPVSAMDGGVDGLVDEAKVRAALAAIAREAPMDAPDATPWIALAAGEYGDREVVILGVGSWSSEGGPGAGAQDVGLERTETGLKVTSWGDCQLSIDLPDGRTQVEITAPADGVDGGSTTPTVMANERECTSGRDPVPFLGAPEVIETAERVVVTMTSEASTGDQNCQGNPSVPVTLELAEPIGDRELVDGGVWPPRPIKVG
jgi:predicted small lipoprotein YifL